MTPGPDSQDGARDLIGSDLGQFRDLQELGAGGMGVVYRAVDSRLKRPVALKFLPAKLASDPDRLARFEHEAETVAGLNHPNIVTIYSVEEADGHRFIAMELVEGQSLDRIIPSDGLPVDELLDIAVPLADALCAAHDRKIVHRDLKPANIMRTSSGLLKVLDFGLAKLYSNSGEVPSDEENTETMALLTQEGMTLGTPGYMSPEQVRGEPVDHRTDIFALGIVLYEMATGSRPFSGSSAMDIASSILRDNPPSITEVRQKLPRHLGRIVSQCLEKDADKRLQTAKDLRNQLTGLQKELESERILGRSSAQGAARPIDGGLPRAVIWGGAAVVGSLAVVLALWLTRSVGLPAEVAAPTTPPTAVGQVSVRPSLAVLPFQNLSGNESTDWLRSGIPEMLVTSLADSRVVEVLPGRRTHQILASLDATDSTDPGEDDLRRFVEESRVASLLRGSFVQLGDRYRIDLRIEDGSTGRILYSDQAEADGETEIFPAIDRLSRGVLNELDTSSAGGTSPEVQIEEVTTSSMEAFRYYSEGVRLRNQIKRRESLAMFEKAVELDPGFAMALSSIGTAYLNLGDAARAKEYARRAFENSARAPARERHFIQGRYLSLEWATYGQAIEALRRTVNQYSDHRSARNILANRLTAVGDYQRAIPHLERLVAEDPRYAGNVWLLSSLYAAEDRLADAQAVVSEYQRLIPENWYGDLIAGLVLLRQGRPEEALAALESADAKRPGMNEVREVRWAALIESERWPEAEAEARAQLASDDPYYQWAGSVYLARSELYRGRSRESLAALAAASAVYDGDGPLAGLSLAWSADLSLLTGDPDPALDDAVAAQMAGRAQWPELRGLFLSGVALEALDRRDEADEVAAELERRAGLFPNIVETRQALHLSGLLAASRGENDEALDDLTRAAALLPPRGLFYMDRHRQLPDHVPLWFSLATTLVNADRSTEAALWFERIVESRLESRNFPVRYGRSLFLLARIKEDQGRADEARALYERFLDLWAEGDLDRDRIEEARGKIR